MENTKGPAVGVEAAEMRRFPECSAGGRGEISVLEAEQIAAVQVCADGLDV